MAAQDTATAEETIVGTSKRSPFSLISAENVQKALWGVAITNTDHYGRLGLAMGCSYDQVTIAYKKKCEELRNQELDEEEVGKQLELLKESYEILSSEEEGRLYDWSLSRSEKPERYMWPFEVDITQTPTEPPLPQEQVILRRVPTEDYHVKAFFVTDQFGYESNSLRAIRESLELASSLLVLQLNEGSELFHN